MSWNDPCSECGIARRDCVCLPSEPRLISAEEKKKLKAEKIKQEKICERKGHDFQYSFIVYDCKRCGYSTEY